MIKGCVLASALAITLAGCHHQDTSAYFTLEQATSIPQSAPFSINDAKDVPVIERGKPGSWDGSDVLNPSVIQFNGKLYNYFSGYDGKTWHTGLATSTDGKKWDMYAGNPILSPGYDWSKSFIEANGSAIVWKGKVLYFYQGKDAQGITQIGAATSSDGIHFTAMQDPVFTPGTPHAWDGAAVGDPYVIEHNGKLILYYLGMDDFYVQRLGVAQSDDGIHWTRFAENPVLDVGAKGSFSENGLGEPSVIYNAPYFYMLYTGRSADERRDIGWAISSDGVHWKNMSQQGLFGDQLRAEWDGKVICDTTLLRNNDGSVSVWFGGGNENQPAQGLHGQIGLLHVNLPAIPSSYDANTSSYALSGGWSPDGGAGSRSAWIGSSASLILMKPASTTHLIVSGWLPYSFHKKAGATGPLTITILANGKVIDTKSTTDDGLFSITVPAEKMQSGMPVKISIDTDHVFKPSAIESSNDQRQLALKITKIAFQ